MIRVLGAGVGVGVGGFDGGGQCVCRNVNAFK